ncbi:MAG: OmpP1/FadL family transporter [Desulfurella sp.]
MKKLSKVAILASLGLILSVKAFAGNVDTYGIGAKATSLGGAYAAWANDPFALYYNPAGLAQINKPEVTLGFENVKPFLTVNSLSVEPLGVYPTPNPYSPIGVSPGGTSFGSFTDNSATMTIPNFGIALPVSKKLTLGFGVYVPFGLSISWTNSPLNPLSYNSYKSWYYREVFAFGAGYKITDNLFIGGAINIGTTQSGVERYAFGVPLLTAKESQQTHLPLTSNAAVKTNLADYHNFSWNLGIMYKPVEWLTLGATYRSMTHTHLTGTAQVQYTNPLTASIANQQLSASTDVDAPDQFQLGVNIKPSDKLRFEVDWLWTRWSVVGGYTVYFSQPLFGVKSSEYFPRDWKDTNTIKFGIEYKPIEMLALRGGFYYDPTPIPSSTFDAQWPDANKYMFTGGVGLNFKRWKIDTDVFYSTTAGNTNISNSKNLNATYGIPGVLPQQSTDVNAKAHIWGYGLNVTYVF